MPAAAAKSSGPKPETPAAPQQTTSPLTARPKRAPAPAPASLIRPAGPKSRGIVRPKVSAVSGAPSLAAGPGQPVITLSGPGEPLAKDVRARLESTFGTDLSDVRVHQGESASHLALAHGARAFAYGHHVVLGQRANASDIGLMAHEVAHVLQQGQSPTVQRCGEGGCGCTACRGGSASEDEAARASQAAMSGGSLAIAQHAPSGSTQLADEEEGWLEAQIWSLLESHAPSLVPIIRKGPAGVLDWVKDKVTGAVRSFFDTLMAPVRGIATVGTWLHGHFAPLVTWMQDAAAKIAQNDCKPITEAIQKIEDLATKIITPVVEKLQEIAGKIGDFFKGLWDKFGAPVWDFIKKYAGQQWDQLQKLGEWIWDKTAPIRRLAARAWTWLKNKIGIGEGPEGQNGILQWIQGKATAAWDWVQAKLEPYKKQITAVATVIGGILLMISPAGPIILAGAAIYGVIQGVRWLRANMAGGNAIVKARTHAQTVLIPQLMAGINKMTAAVTKMAGSVSGKLGEFAAGLGRLVGAAASTALEFLVEAAQWLAQKAVDLAAWATEKLTSLANWIERGLTRLINFLQPVLNFFKKVGDLLIDIYGLPFLLAGELWKKIPSCIRDPFVDWIIPLILRQIEIFKELVKDNEAWQKTKADVMNIIRLVFVNKDLKGAIKAVFNLILRVFNVPIDLLVKVVAKAQVAWETVTNAPIKFLKNCVRTIGRAFQMYWDKLWDNLMGGVEGWLFGEVASKGITRPKSWTDPWDLLQFALDIMGLSVSHIFDLMEKDNRFSKTTVDKLRVWYARLSKVWDWIMEMRGKSPGEVTKAIITNAKDFGVTILEGIVSWIVERVSVELATMAAAAAASAGLSEVLDVIRRIYRAIKTAVRWMRTILEMVNSGLDAVMDIAAGTLEPPATIVLNAMKKGTAAVIGFLADQVGLSGVGEKIREIIDKIRAKVDNAILMIIDKLKALFQSIAQGVKEGVAALLEWWKEKFSFKVGGAPHELSFQGEKDSAVLMLKSTPKPLEAVIASLKTGATTKAKKDAVKAIEDEVKIIDKIKTDTKGNFGQDAGKTISQSLKNIAKQLAIAGLDPVPPTEVEFTPQTVLGDSVGETMVAEPLSLDPGKFSGSAPAASAETELWRRVNRRPNTYVQGHLLNHHLHGSGALKSNLTPITRSANTTMESQAESAIKNPVLGEGVVVRYEVTMNGKHGTRKNIPEEGELPVSITMKAWRMESDNGTWKKTSVLLSPVTVPNTLPADTPAGVVRPHVDLSTSAKSEIDTIPNIGPVIAARIISLRKKFTDGRFNTYDDLSGADGIGDETVKALREDPFVKLHD